MLGLFRLARSPRLLAAAPSLAVPRPAAVACLRGNLSSSLCTPPPPLQPASSLVRMLSTRVRPGGGSSLAGLEQAGMPRLERDSRGRSIGALKGGKGRRALGGVIAIKNTWNNTLISISDSSYKQLGFVSGGTVGFKKSKRSSQFATEKALTTAFEKAKDLGIRKVMIAMTGPALTLRKPLFKQLREDVGIRVMKLKMNDNVPHGGCRPRKSRRRRWRTKSRRL